MHVTHNFDKDGLFGNVIAEIKELLMIKLGLLSVKNTPR